MIKNLATPKALHTQEAPEPPPEPPTHVIWHCPACDVSLKLDLSVGGPNEGVYTCPDCGGQRKAIQDGDLMKPTGS